MRRDVYIENDSGGLSVIAGDAVDAIIADQRSDDLHFVKGYKALLLELYGDDSMPIRFVIDEPLRPDEEQQWLARATWRIDSTDGRLLVTGGFDPDMLAWWKEETGGQSDGRGVAIASVPRGPLRVDLYAHTGSMNGREVLCEAREKPGKAFRRSHPGRPFPLWLANMLDCAGEDDPGHEQAWNKVRDSVASGALAIEADGKAAIGFLVHVQPGDFDPGDAPDSGWFERDLNARVPKVFPVGLETDVTDGNIEIFRDGLLGRSAPEPEMPIVTDTVAITEGWTGDPLTPIRDNTPIISVAPGDASWLYWMAALTADSSPRFEYRLTPKGPWTPPDATPHFAAIETGSVIALRPSSQMGGWGLWHGAQHASAVLAGVPEGSSLELRMAPAERNDGEEVDPAIARARYRGVIRNGRLELTDASPAVDRATLADALAFVGELVTHQRIRVRGDAEREILEQNIMIFAAGDDTVIWDGDTARLFEHDERTLVMLASPVFRSRFGGQWKCEEEEAW
jgi:hypothetical protein